jgi:hypothetical protein
MLVRKPAFSFPSAKAVEIQQGIMSRDFLRKFFNQFIAIYEENTIKIQAKRI